MKLYSLSQLMKLYAENKELIHARSAEGYAEGSKGRAKIAGMGLAIFMTLLIITFVIWVWALVLLIKYWKVLPSWAQVIGLLGMVPVVPLGPIVTIVVVLVGKNDGGAYKST